MASLVAAGAAKGIYNLFAKDRNVLIPLDNPKKTSLVTDEQLKKQFCDKEKSIKELEGTIKKLKKLKNKDPAKILTNLERVVDRLSV